MTEEKNSRALKILTAVLTLGIIALGVYTITFYNENQKNVIRLEDEKASLETDLSELIVKYDTAMEDNSVMSKELKDAKSRIELLLESLKEMDQTNYAIIKRYQNEIKNLERERQQLFSTVDSLSRQNQRLATVVDSTQTALKQRIIYSDSLAEQNEILSSKVAQESLLKLSGLKGEGVVLRNSGNAIDTNRHRRVEKIRACFTVTQNLLADIGQKQLYVQVINPKNNLVGKTRSMLFGEKILNFSEIAVINYSNEGIDNCVLVDVKENDLVSGIYTVNIFDAAVLLATTNFELK